MPRAPGQRLLSFRVMPNQSLVLNIETSTNLRDSACLVSSFWAQLMIDRESNKRPAGLLRPLMREHEQRKGIAAT